MVKSVGKSSKVFRRKKKINEELEQIEKELFKQYEKIGEDVDIMNKLKSAISNNNDITEVDDDTLLSYYDLLTTQKVLHENFVEEKYYKVLDIIRTCIFGRLFVMLLKEIPFVQIS